MASITFSREAFSIFRVIPFEFCANAPNVTEMHRTRAIEKRFNAFVK